ncbi:MAG TPA: nuclear transport factor 2 family protein [Candidatus Acidoferrum sp.]|nr:nuclear transport factor 2 family protein [Candidatus Acidoferrum sp.]
MDAHYQINLAKTEFREAHNHGDVDRLLSVMDEKGFVDMSEGGPSRWDDAAREGLRESAMNLFAEYSVQLSVIIIKIVILGDVAYDYGWHEFTMKPKSGGETVRKRQRYFEVWRKSAEGKWKITFFINNADVREEVGGQASHWFFREGTETEDGTREMA